MADEYMSLTDLGKLYGVSRVKIGEWLVEVGLRTKEKKPSKTAFDGGFVEQRASTQPGTYFYVWHREKTCELLDVGHMRAEAAQAEN